MSLRNLTIFLILVSLIACRSGSDVIGKSFIQKRKYQPGWHVELGNRKQQSADVKSTVNAPHNMVYTDKKLSDATDVTMTTGEQITPTAQVLKCSAIPFALSFKSIDVVLHGSVHKAFGLKKKRKSSEKFTKGTQATRTFVVLGSWFIGWPINIPIICLVLSLTGVIIGIMTLMNLKKSKKRNRRMCIFAVIYGIILAAFALAVML